MLDVTKPQQLITIQQLFTFCDNSEGVQKYAALLKQNIFDGEEDARMLLDIPSPIMLSMISFLRNWLVFFSNTLQLLCKSFVCFAKI